LEPADDKSGGSNRDYYLYVMSRIYPRGKWIDAGVVGHFVTIVCDPRSIKQSAYSDEFRLAVITLSVAELDDKTRDSVVERLEGALDLAFEEESLSANELALALSRMRPQRSRAVLQQLYRRLPSLKPLGDIVPFAIRQSDTAYLVANDEIAKVLVELTASEDAEVSERVALSFTFYGVVARTAVPLLLDFIKSNADEARRFNAAAALEWIAGYSDVEKIETAAKAETSKRVSEALLDAVKALRRFD
jgi:hypothetical protein